jgi:hypothetical protein
VAANGVEKLRRLYIDSEVDDLPAIAGHHHQDQVFADVMQVAGHRAEHETTLRLHRAGQEERFQMRHHRVHRLGGHEQFGHKGLAATELRADPLHPVVAGLQNNLRPSPGGEGLPRELIGAGLALHVLGIR